MSAGATEPLHPGREPRAGWRRLEEGAFDLVVVGGGIHGAGVARSAALRGLRVALVERGDWASGTSSRSSKLLHGGLRYLRAGEIGLVRESLRERDLHRRLAPAQVVPLRFRVPPSPAGPPRWQIRAGIALYDLLTLGASRGRPWAAEPSYLDARIDDARFCLDVVLDARRHGAVALNYTEWTGWERAGGRVTGARVRDRLSGGETVVRAPRFVNATGPWVGETAPEPILPGVRLTRGTHVVLEQRVDGARLVFAPDDGRVLFLLPFGDAHALFGTTDVDAAGPDPEPRPDPGEIRYLARACRALFPALAGRRPVGVLSGLRPLVDAPGDPSGLSREERIVEQDAVVSIVGGKYTTYRAVAERVLDRVERGLGRPRRGEDPTRRVPIPAAPSDGTDAERIDRAFAAEDAARVEDVLLRRTPWGHTGAWRERVGATAAAWRRRFGASEADAARERERCVADGDARLAVLEDWDGVAGG